jgi:hypothetical protein
MEVSLRFMLVMVLAGAVAVRGFTPLPQARLLATSSRSRSCTALAVATTAPPAMETEHEVWVEEEEEPVLLKRGLVSKYMR